ncbi:hypothetical protein GPECTOR_21g720 [Gonium pectorale]|uniref:LysM domain-containing protein n=1 Tax=Gonium pectorale TaxID=33097 RepID=A0A150GI35_GONPE|nr:hypothetical protein GPECTOR_21g720 [Gonium pectorale]|eukprot:KXZ49494.1 hypothetical protein GPECTOR_21g720 [Gonium pectorale]
MFGSASIPTGLLPGGTEGQGWSIGPLKLPFSSPLDQAGGRGGGGGAGGTPPDVLGAVQRLKEVVSEGLHASAGRGGVASTSKPAFPAAGRKAVAMRLEYSEDTPRLVGKRSIALRPRNTLPLSGYEPLYDDRDARWWDVKETALHGSYSWALQDYQSDREDVPVPGDAWRAEVPSEEELPPVLTCRDLVKQVLVDQRGREDAIQCAYADQKCPAGTYKVMAFTSPLPDDDDEANYIDHHFYVQHKDVYLTLQPGDRLQDVARFFKLPVEELYDANPGMESVPADRPMDRERSVLVPDANVWSHKPSEWLPPRLHDGAGRAIHNPLRAVAAFSDDEGNVNELPAQYCCAFCVRRGTAKTGPQSPPVADVQE